METFILLLFAENGLGANNNKYCDLSATIMCSNMHFMSKNKVAQ